MNYLSYEVLKGTVCLILYDSAVIHYVLAWESTQLLSGIELVLACLIDDVSAFYWLGCPKYCIIPITE